VHSFVIGAGIGICGASDVVIASEDAYFSLPEIDRGALGGASHLSRLFPLHKLRAALFTGGRITAAEAHRLGAVERLVSPKKLLKEARAFAGLIAAKSRSGLILAKEALNGLEPRDVDCVDQLGPQAADRRMSPSSKGSEGVMPCAKP
jgi:enoyl-CoA hydratase